MENEQNILSDFPGLFTGNTNPPAESENEENAQQAPAPVKDEAPASDKTDPEAKPAESSVKPTDKQETPPSDDATKKANEAFAKLRTENAAKSKMLAELAQLLGVENKDGDALMEQLKAKIIEEKAKTQNVPPEILKELETLRAKQEEFDRFQRRQDVQRSFSEIKNEFDLSTDELQGFITELTTANINPFVDNVDLKAEYLKRHFADLREKAIAEGIRRESERARKAQTNSTAPIVQNGKLDNKKQAQVNSVVDLEKFLAQLEIK
jgi:hypothetical protein